MLTIKKAILRYLNSTHGLSLLLLSAVLSFPLALVVSVVWFTISEREYSIRNLASVAPFAFICLMGIIWLIAKKFLIHTRKHVSQGHISWKQIVTYLVDFCVLIAVACGMWINLGSVIFDPPQFKHEVSISPLNNSTGEICILEITNDDGIKINEKIENIIDVFPTDALDPLMSDCQLFLPKSSIGSLNFSYVGPLDDTLTFLVKSNREAGNFLVRVNGVKTVVFNLYDEQSGYTLRNLSFNHGARMLVWNLVGVAGLTAFFLVFLMIMMNNSDLFTNLSYRITLSDRFVIIVLIVSIILLFLNT